jgi:hypothetical protein
LNKKGQFSIIAALLVAVVLIATVIITYSSIRNSVVQDQPQVLSAIDETNLALKQILGFTVGYYGSVLQVTGNTSYAKALAVNYLQSGLVNIANIHPEWGISFNLTNPALQVYWFTNRSYSMGNLAVTYNLTGLGVDGIKYSVSSKLKAEVLGTNSLNQSILIVTKDDVEPLINLGKQNFKFYRYSGDSTWGFVSPSTEPTAYANGTYFLDIPSGVDRYSYVVEVEDPRGIIVVASSFSHYIIDLSWNLQSPAKYAVTGSTSQILGVPDKNYATIGKGSNCSVTDYQGGGTGTIKKVYFNVTYYTNGSISGTLAWAYRLDGGTWTTIPGTLPEGGTANSPLRATYNATSLRPSWTWSNLNTTDIQFQNNDDSTPENAYVDAMYVTLVLDTAGDYSTIPDATIIGELLQNGTIRWLGQNLQSTTAVKPIPPVPVKNIRLNQTINGIDREVPFQLEDWASNYRMPVGLTNNASVFSSRTMLVFLATPKASRITLWWTGSDTSTQTPYAFTNRYFTGDNLNDPDDAILTNGILRLRVQIVGGEFRVTSNIVGLSVICTARFMRVNSEASTYGSGTTYVVHHGIVRDIIQQEAEFSGGVANSPNFYTHIVLTLPANASYYTYQLRTTFVQSQQSRTVSDLCPIRLTVSTGSPQTENGTSSGFPIVRNGTGTFYNYSSSVWQHQWTQMWASGNRGAGLMFTSSANQKLYAFDTASKTGALKVDSSARTIELLPITRFSVSFTSSKDIVWYGAVATFDGTTPIYTVSGGKKTGLWIMVEYPPTITITTGN